MQARTKFAVLTGVAVFLALLALLGGALSVYLVLLGSRPPPGGGSLGHVGIVIAGLVVGFASIVLALLGTYTGLRARAVQREQDPPR